VVRGIDTLGNARFVRTVLERAQEHRSARLVSEFGLAEIDLSDQSAGAEIGTEALEVLTEATWPRDWRPRCPAGYQQSCRRLVAEAEVDRSERRRNLTENRRRPDRRDRAEFVSAGRPATRTPPCPSHPGNLSPAPGLPKLARAPG